jgi:subtilisin-like proprotein convertase family protein
MKKAALLIGILLLALARPALADFVFNFDSGFANGGVIPDNSLTGWSDSRTISIPGYTDITGLTVSLDLSGGWNGDLYAYLVESSGFVVLLNRVGVTANNSVGYGNGGMTVTFSDAASGNIHSYGGLSAPNGTYQPDGRNISPLSSPATFSSTSPSTPLSSFDGLNPNGTWTLFIADVSPGFQSTITGWDLDIAAVPEPRSLVEGGIAALFLGVLIGLYRLKGPKTLRLTGGVAWWRAVNEWLNAV